MKWRTTRDRHTGEIIDDTAILPGEDASDLKWIYEFPDGKGIRDIVTEFWYEPTEPRTREIKNGEWKRIMGDVTKHVSEHILFLGDGKVVSNFEECNAADDLAEIFSPPRVLDCENQNGISGDLALDLKTGWGCSKKEDRMRAMA